MAKVLRVANASGFYGDRFDALREQVEGGPIDVLTGDWLAELTMILLRRDQERDPEGGYARTFPDQLAPVLTTCLERGIRIVTNAGGRNPHALARAVRELADAHGLSPTIAVVDGDDVLEVLDEWRNDGEALARLPDGLPLVQEERTVVGASAYLGCSGIVHALRAGAEIVITGRVTDPALVMGPAAWYFGWQSHHYDLLAASLVAGHLLECGTQVTGGNDPFWDDDDDDALPAFPIAELHADGTVVVTKHEGTPGRIDVDTVKAQLLYEITGREIASPDVVGQVDSVMLLDAGPDRVQITGATGHAPRSTLKVVLELDAGWRNRVHLLVNGPDVTGKVERLAAQFWERVGGTDTFTETRTDVVGGLGDPAGGPLATAQLVVLSARHTEREPVDRGWSNRSLELVLASVPGVTLLRPPSGASRCAALWPALVPRARVTQRVHIGDEVEEVPHPTLRGSRGLFDEEVYEESTLTFQPVATGVVEEVPLGRLCGARSGDKGGDATLGLWVRNPQLYGWLTDTVTTRCLREWLAPAGFDGPIERVVFPNLSAVLFVIRGYLGEGVGSSIRVDPQAKLLGEYIRSCRVSVDRAILDEV